MTLTIAAVGSLVDVTNTGTVSFTTQNVGDVVLVVSYSGSSFTITGISDTNSRMTWTELGSALSPVEFAGSSIFIAMGVVTSVGSTTITLAHTGTPGELMAQEFQPSQAVTWLPDQFGDLGTSSGNVLLPTLVPSTVGPEVYVGYALLGGSVSSGVGAGFTFVTSTSGSRFYGYNPSVTGSVSPYGVGSGGSWAAAALIMATGWAPPTVGSEASTSYGPTIQVLEAVVNPNGASATVSFNFGPTTSYGSVTNSVTIAGNSPVTVAIPAVGLTLGDAYHFQCVATNSQGTTDGSDATFTTVGLPSYGGG